MDNIKKDTVLNFKIFLSLRFYVKSILEELEVLKLHFGPL